MDSVYGECVWIVCTESVAPETWRESVISEMCRESVQCGGV